MYSVQEEVLLVLTMELILVNDHNHPLLHQERHRRLTGENPAKNGNLKGESLSGLKGRNRVEISLEGPSRNRRVTSGTLPCA